MNIGYNGLDNFSKLKSLTIPSSVATIGGIAFNNCYSLTSVTFENKTIDQVKSMTDYPWNAYYTMCQDKDTCIFHCSDGDIDLSKEF